MHTCQDDSATINSTFSNRTPKSKLCSVPRHAPQLCRQCGYSWYHKKPVLHKKSSVRIVVRIITLLKFVKAVLHHANEDQRSLTQSNKSCIVLKFTLQTTPAQMKNTCLLWLYIQHSENGPSNVQQLLHISIRYLLT